MANNPGLVLLMGGLIAILVGTGFLGGASGAVIPGSVLPGAIAAATNFYYLGAQTLDSSVYPNNGVQAQIQVINSNAEGSGCMSFWVSEALRNNNWGQVGYYLCAGGPAVPFYQIWNLDSNTVLNGGSLGGSPTPGMHLFSMQSQSQFGNPNLWVFTMDGIPIGQYNMGSSTSGNALQLQALSEEQSASSPFAIPSVTFSGMQGLVGGNWVNWGAGTALNQGANWGLTVNGPDSFSVGGSASTPSTGTPLWSSSSSSTVTTTVTSTVTITSFLTSTVTSGTTSYFTTTVTSTVPTTITNSVTTTVYTTVVTTTYLTSTVTSGTTSYITSTQTQTTTVTTTVPASTTVTSTVTSTSYYTTTITGTTTTVVTSTQTVGSTITNTITTTSTLTTTSTITTSSIIYSTITSIVTSTINVINGIPKMVYGLPSLYWLAGGGLGAAAGVGLNLRKKES